MVSQPSSSVELDVPADVLAAIERIAKATDRDPSWVMVRALRFYLAGEGADIITAIEGREEIDAGNVHDMDEVLKEIEEIVRKEP